MITKSKITADGVIKDRPHTLLLDAIEKRESCPDAFLFSAEEFKIMYRARECVSDVSAKYRNIPDENVTEEIEAQMLIDYKEAFKRRRVPVKKLLKFDEKLKTSLYWSCALHKIEIKSARNIQEHYRITTSTPETYPERIITPDSCPEFYAAEENTAARRAALGLPEMYLYISASELIYVKTILLICNAIKEAEAKAEEIKENEPEQDTTQPLFFTIINSPEMNALSCIDTRKEPKKTHKLNEHGENISFFEYYSNLGVKVLYDQPEDPLKGQGLLSVGEPNADKLLLQAEAASIRTGEKTVYISMDDFMKLRGLKDPTTANDTAKRACYNLLHSTVWIDEETPNAQIYGGFHYVQKCKADISKGKKGQIIITFTDDVYNHIQTFAAAGRQIEKIDAKLFRIPAMQDTAYNIARKFSSHMRINAEKPTACRLSVKTLLSYCTALPLYPENKEDRGKEHYIRKPSEAKTRIIKRFIDSLDYLVDAEILKEYRFTHEGGKPLTKKELKRLEEDFLYFRTVNVEVEFFDDPDYSHLIESKTKRIEEAKKKKRTPRS